MDFLFNLTNILTAVVTALVSWGGTFLFFKQEKKSRDIDNEAKQSDEWRKLYLESQEDSRKKDEKIDELRKEMGELRRHMFSLERRVQINTIYRCDKMDCKLRVRTSNESISEETDTDNEQ